MPLTLISLDFNPLVCETTLCRLPSIIGYGMVVTDSNC